MHSLEEEIRRYIGSFAGVEVLEEPLREFLLKMSAKSEKEIRETIVGICQNVKETTIIKIAYSGNPIKGIKKSHSTVERKLT